MKLITKFGFSILMICIAMGAVFSSCSDDDDDDNNKVDEQGIVGIWKATSGKYNLTLEITKTGYDFLLSEPGNGGVTDKGTYELSKEKYIFINNQESLLAMGELKNGKLSLTFVNSIMIMMLGTKDASLLTFTRSEGDGDDGDDDKDDKGYLIVQNLSENYDIVSISLYDKDGNYVGSDTDLLESGYQFEYEFPTGSYTLKITNDINKSYTSKTFKVIKNKVTVLAYTGSSFDILATGIDPSKLSSKPEETEMTSYSVPNVKKIKLKVLQPE